VIGIWIGTEGQKIADAIDEILTGVGAWGGFSRLGTFSVGRVAVPDASPADFFTTEDIIEIERQPLPLSVDPIVWRTRVGYQRNYTLQGDLAAGVSATRRTFAAEEYRFEAIENPSLQSRHVLAKDLEPVGHHYRDQASALSEATRLFTLWGTERQLIRIRLPARALTRDLGEVVNVTHTRYGLENGADARVLGHALEDAAVDLLVLL
jgi:hypothetical protein